MSVQFPKRRETDEEAAERVKKIEERNSPQPPQLPIEFQKNVPDRELKAAIKEVKKFTGGE
jgi:hypothetical protein